MIGIAVGLFLFFVIGLELYTGFAFLGWAGDNRVVEREKSPGPYWFAISFHLLIAIGFPLLMFLM